VTHSLSRVPRRWSDPQKLECLCCEVMPSDNAEIGAEEDYRRTEMMNGMSYFDEMKEEKAVSFLEREEDEYQPKQLAPLHQYESNQQSQRTEYETERKCPIYEKQQQEELRVLRKRLETLRKRRWRIQQSARIDCAKQQELLLERLNTRRRDRNQTVDEYVSAWKGRDSTSLFLDCARRWNVLNDCFYIWVDGKNGFATINGCRLGAEAIPLPTDLLISARDNNNITNKNDISPSKSKWVSSTTKNSTTTANGTVGNSPPRRRLLGLFGSNSNNDANSNGAAAYIPRRASSIPTMTEPTRVPWLEINAALGHACLLLKILQESSSKNAGTGMKFTHELHPMGSTSKIGIRFGTPDSGAGVLAAATGFGSILSSNSTSSIANGTAPVVYNFFFEEASGFSFFKNNARDFNWSLQAFLQCIAEAAAQQTDKTIAIPHVIRHEKIASEYHSRNNVGTRTHDNSANHLNGGEWTIGGLSICYPSQTAAAGNAKSSQGGGGVTTEGSTNSGSAVNSAALEWTKACRYLLTDLKWLVAYSAKHVDR